jgi:hypothetical protein
MTNYTVRVRLANGSYVDVRIQAESPTYARQIAEAQYGAGAVCGMW